MFDGLNLRNCSGEEEITVFRSLISQSYFPVYDCEECLSPCHYTNYKFRVGFFFLSQFSDFQLSLYQVKNTAPSDNKTVLRINAEKFWVKGSSEKLVFTFVDLLVNVGGFLGLFIGLSLNDVFSTIVDRFATISTGYVKDKFVV